MPQGTHQAGNGGRRNLTKDSAAQDQKSFPYHPEHPEILSNEQVRGPLHNRGPLTHTEQPDYATLVSSPSWPRGLLG